MSSLDLTRSQQRAILLSYLLAFLVGIPYWWYITTVPRATLPHNDIINLKSATNLPIVFDFDWDSDCNDVHDLLGWSIAPFSSTINVVALETEINSQCDDILNSRRIPLSSNPDWSLSFHVSIKDKSNSSQQPFNRVCVISSPSNDYSTGTVIVSDNGTVGVIASKSSEVAPTLVTYVTHLANLLAHPLKSIHFSESYEVLLSLMVQNPVATPIRTWSASQVAQSHIHPLLHNLLGDKSRYKLVSQIQYLTVSGEGVDIPFTDNNKIDISDSVTEELLEPSLEVKCPNKPISVQIPADQLPLFINPDWNLASVTPNHTAVHLVAFIPDPSTPMTILDESGNLVKSNSFISPRWGSVKIHNLSYGTHTLNDTDVIKFARAWTKHLRTLFGVIPLQEPITTVSGHQLIFMPSRRGITTTEVAMYYLSQYIDNITKASEILQALIRLTDSLDHLPISPKISNLVHQALATIKNALDVNEDSRMGSALCKYRSSWQTRVKAELAFFDSDMVGLAYFPSEHTYAVYMPLFVPVLVTIMSVVAVELRLWKKGK